MGGYSSRRSLWNMRLKRLIIGQPPAPMHGNLGIAVVAEGCREMEAREGAFNRTDMCEAPGADPRARGRRS
jgi:hypothetical protein